MQEGQDAAPDDRRHAAWFAAAKAGDIATMASVLATQPELLDTMTQLRGMKSTTSALHIAVWHNHTEAVAWLLDTAGATLELVDANGMTPLLIDLARVGVEHMFPYPLKRSRCIDVGSPVEVAKLKREFVKDRSTYSEMDTSTLDVLLARGANVNHRSNNGDAPLLLAVQDGLIKHVELLLARGADMLDIRDAHGRTTLEIACQEGYVDIASVLLEHAPQLVDIAGEPSVRGAVRHDFPEILSCVLPKVLQSLSTDAARIDFRGRLLHLAVEFDAVTCAEYLIINSGVDINWQASKDEGGRTALHLACIYQRVELLWILLEHGANGDLCCDDDRGSSAYHLALDHVSHNPHDGSSERLIELLAQHGANINLLDLVTIYVYINLTSSL